MNEMTSAALVDAALDTELDALYLGGHSPAPGRTLFYALRWHLSLTNDSLPLASQARQGHARKERPTLQQPETWEATLLMASALLDSSDPMIAPSERLAGACGFLLSFDVYGRATDLPKALAAELRAPARYQTGAASQWTLTLYPATAAARETQVSKTNTTDDTVAIGISNPKRRWLQTLCAGISRLPHPEGLLLGLSTKRYYQLFNHARAAAALPASSPHRLRHGGASVDSLQQGDAKLTDLDIASRGRWAALTSVRRYRQPATYLRELSKLTLEQVLKPKDLETSLPPLLRKLLKK